MWVVRSRRGAIVELSLRQSMTLISDRMHRAERMSQQQWTWSTEDVIRSRLGAHESFLQQVLDKLTAEDWHPYHIFGIRLALEEALVNAVRHGNELDEQKHVRAVCHLNEQRIRIEIADQGSGFDPTGVPDPTTEENLEKPCGRGILLMRNYMTRVDYNQSGNRVVMEKLRSDPVTPSDAEQIC